MSNTKALNYVTMQSFATDFPTELWNMNFWTWQMYIFLLGELNCCGFTEAETCWCYYKLREWHFVYKWKGRHELRVKGHLHKKLTNNKQAEIKKQNVGSRSNTAAFLHTFINKVMPHVWILHHVCIKEGHIAILAGV